MWAGLTFEPMVAKSVAADVIISGAAIRYARKSRRWNPARGRQDVSEDHSARTAAHRGQPRGVGGREREGDSADARALLGRNDIGRFMRTCSMTTSPQLPTSYPKLWAKCGHAGMMQQFSKHENVL
jgi:hypothetical protein